MTKIKWELYYRKGVNSMKKIITASIAIVILAVIVSAFTACGDDKKVNDTTALSRESTVRESTTMLPNENDGKISDTSGDGNGVAGDIVSDVSRGLTELSEALSEAF